MIRIAAGRRARQQRLAVAILATASALILMAAGGSWLLTSYVSSHFGRLDAGTAGTPASGPLNILVAGVDIRAGLTARQQAELHVGHDVSDNSDTLMLVHVAADHSRIEVVSLPRDSWVNIPGHGMNKINAAIGIGGAPLMVRTVEQATGLTINDYVEVNFLGFVQVIDALGGVNICLPFAVDDSYSGLHLSAGVHHVDGITALEYARDRHSFALSDLSRISDQQQLMATLLSNAIGSGTLANPIRLHRFLASATSAIQVDQGFNVIRLADELRGIQPADVTFTTVPLASLSYLTPTGQSAVLWDSTAARAMFARLKADRQPTAPTRPPSPAPPSSKARALRPADVSVDVYNGTTIGGLAARTGSRLAGLGYQVHAELTWSAQDNTETVIDYPAGQQAAGRLLSTALPGAQLRQAAGLSRVQIVLGTTGDLVGSAPRQVPAPASPPAAPGQQRTAAQDVCS
jgi:LCP family protein required for cell wall assembly